MGGRVRPTLVIGVGLWGAWVAAAFVRWVGRRAGRLPVVHAVALVGEGTDAPSGVATVPIPAPDSELAAALAAELGRIRQLEAVQVSQRAGWDVESGAGSGVTIVARLGDDEERAVAPRVARWLRDLGERDYACRVALGAVLLAPRRAEGDDAADRQHEAVLRADETRAISADDASLFDEGCALLCQVNADGLLVPAGREQAERVGNWLALRATTSLQAALDRMPPLETGHRFDTFGLASWDFPLEALGAHLARRWQREVLGRLLAPHEGDPPNAAAFVEQCGPAGGLGLPELPLRFRVDGESWATPPLDLVSTLRSVVDEAVEAEWARLGALVARGEEALGAACREARAALAAEVDALLDGAGLGAGEAFLDALEESAWNVARRLEQEAERCCARAAELSERADQAARALDGRTGRFPPLRFRTLVGLILRPWRLLHLWLLYREIGRRCGAYLAYRQSQWLLRAEGHERQRQAAFYAALAQAAGEEKGDVAQLRARLERLRGGLAPDPAAERAMIERLEAGALPAGLADYFYRRVAGDEAASPRGVLALYGPLSRWMREGWEDETLGLTLAEHAREQFAFLAEVRLDELLARTYSGAELRRRLAALVDAAAPWWAWDEGALGAEERARARRVTLVGLPDADSSPLADVLPDGPGAVSCFSTGDRRQVLAVQVIQGLG